MTENENQEPTKKIKLLRCMDWLHKQHEQQPNKLALLNKNDIQFIIQTNADRKNFLLSVAEDYSSVPPGVDEVEVKPEIVPLRQLRLRNLHMVCEWQNCQMSTDDYIVFQKHVAFHIADLHVIDKDTENAMYACLWDICGHKSSDGKQMERHMNYHAYHAKLLAIGYNGRATLKLERCLKDSSKRNKLPPLKTEHCCMWFECLEKFNSIQNLFDHMKLHIMCTDKYQCSWGGCGSKFSNRSFLKMHIRSHTKEKLIACYHCGHHFSTNDKLCNHVARQNVNPATDLRCVICGVACATNYLLREHSRAHICAYACTLCDMSAPTPAALAQHVRYRHLPDDEARQHACPDCPYKAVTRRDLKVHLKIHTRKRKKRKTVYSDDERSDDSDFSYKKVSNDERSDDSDIGCKKKVSKKYICHICPEKTTKVFSRGARLTAHLVKVHGAQWPCGYSRFRYQICKDGMYRLTTTRLEVLEVSKNIMDGYSHPKDSKKLSNSLEFDVKTTEATENTPKRIEITLKNENAEDATEANKDSVVKGVGKEVEITMCDVDDDGNIINSETISDVIYS